MGRSGCDGRWKLHSLTPNYMPQSGSCAKELGILKTCLSGTKTGSVSFARLRRSPENFCIACGSSSNSRLAPLSRACTSCGGRLSFQHLTNTRNAAFHCNCDSVRSVSTFGAVVIDPAHTTIAVKRTTVHQARRNDVGTVRSNCQPPTSDFPSLSIIASRPLNLHLFWTVHHSPFGALLSAN